MIAKNLEPKQFYREMSAFLDSDKKNLLIRGYFDQDKLEVVLYAMGRRDDISKSVFVTGLLSRVPELFNDSLNQNIKVPKLATKYELCGTTAEFVKQTQNMNDDFAFNTDLAVFYPVQSVLDTETSTVKFLSNLSHSMAKKNILITTNDYSDRAERLYNSMDEVLILDMSKVDDEHVETMKNITRNFKRQNMKLPY